MQGFVLRAYSGDIGLGLGSSPLFPSEKGAERAALEPCHKVSRFSWNRHDATFKSSRRHEAATAAACSRARALKVREVGLAWG